ncbi:MAG TPA: M48 family metallopeptidase, partial [Chthoniobacteraceae bacterium]|nr:M48 family metallopeptidase [Chthoniobacteraceae bacterium]
LVALHALDTTAAWLNLKSLGAAMPDAFKDYYDAEGYRKLREYTAARTRFGIVDSTFGLLVLVVFWFAGGFEYLDRAVRALHWGVVPTGLVYIAALGAGRGLLSIPFDVYETFGIEQRFGFNKTTARVYIGDRVKGLALSIVLGAPVLTAVLALFQHAGPHAWIYVWATVSTFMLVMAYAAPAIILPMFNKFTPLEEGELRRAILEYGRANQFPIAGLFVMDGSKRSTKSNAFFTGFGSTKKIVLFDTLIANHTVDELVAVLAHEVGHFKHRHVIQHILLSILNIGVFLFLASLFMGSPALHAAFGVTQVSVWCGLALFMVVFSPLSEITSVALGFLTRAHEFDADRFAVETTRHAGAMIDALKKLSRGNLSNPAPHPLVVALHHSHPPVSRRIEAIRGMRKSQAGG